ncbi:MAG: TVP38/TMEM64 family protein, partial [Thiohalospira sp.]
MSGRWLRIGLAAILVAGIAVVVTYRDHLDPAALEAWVAAAGWAGPVVFVALYAVGAVFFLPGSVMTLAGGALFGPVWGTLLNLAGATLTATLAFLVARYLASEWVANRTGGRLARIIRGVEAEGWRFVAFTRLVPLFPFNLLNYALGLTRIPLVSYAVTTFICMAPG